MSSISLPNLSVRIQIRPRCDVVSILEVLRTGDVAQYAGCRDDGGTGQIGLALPLLAGEIAVPRANLNFSLSCQPDMALCAAAAAGVDDYAAGCEQVLENPFGQELFINPARRRHDLEHDSLLHLPSLEQPGRLGEILEPAVGAGADESRVDFCAPEICRGPYVGRGRRGGPLRRKARDIDLDRLSVDSVPVGGERRVWSFCVTIDFSPGFRAGFRNEADDPGHFSNHAAQRQPAGESQP